MILIWIPIPVHLCRLPPSTPPTPFLIANPNRCSNQHPQPGTSYGCHCCLYGILIHLHIPLHHFFGIVILIIALSRIGFVQRNPPPYPRVFVQRNPPLLIILFFCGLKPSPTHLFFPHLPHKVPETIAPPPGLSCIHWYRHLWMRTRRMIPRR